MSGSTIGATVSFATPTPTTPRKAKEVVMEKKVKVQIRGEANSATAGIDKGREPRGRCNQCGRRRNPCNCNQELDLDEEDGSLSAALQAQAIGTGARGTGAAPAPSTSPLLQNYQLQFGGGHGQQQQQQQQQQQRPRRISKVKHRSLAATLASYHKNADPLARSTSSNRNFNPAVFSTPAVGSAGTTETADSAAMEPPVLSFYGTEPVPLPTRFAQIKRALTAGHEAELEASWARLIEALREEVDHIESRGPQITPSIEYADITDPQRTAQFSRDLKRYGVGVVRGVVPRSDAQLAIDETVKYLETKHDFKEPPPQDPTCFDFFWTPAQVRSRAHPRVLEAQRFAMSLWDNDADDRMATQFPIAYADRLRIHGANIGGVGPDGPGDKASVNGDANGEGPRTAAELIGDFASSTVIAQVDNGSLERWEPDGYGRGGTYDKIFKGEWEKYDPWDPTYRVSATPDLYNGYGACSIFRMYQGMLALSPIDPGLIRLLPSPKLATAYFLLRPFFSPKTKPPERRDGPEWEAFLDPSNWALDKEQTTIIHGAVPGHAQRLTELWHPHLHIRRTLVPIPSLHTGDYIFWHPDLAYHITSNPNVMASRAPSPPPMAADDAPSSRPVSILVYVPAAPLTQTNALYLARQRKTFQRGHPGPDFDATGSGLGSEATHSARPGETEIAQIGGPAGLQAMGLAPFDVAPTPPSAIGSATNGTNSNDGEGENGDVEMDGASSKPTVVVSSAGESEKKQSSATMTPPTTAPAKKRAGIEVARLANIILFPDRYDFYMASKRTRSGETKTTLRAKGPLAQEAKSAATAAPKTDVAVAIKEEKKA